MKVRGLGARVLACHTAELVTPQGVSQRSGKGHAYPADRPETPEVVVAYERSSLAVSSSGGRTGAVERLDRRRRNWRDLGLGASRSTTEWFWCVREVGQSRAEVLGLPCLTDAAGRRDSGSPNR